MASDAQLLEAQIHNAAATLAAGVMANLPDTMPLDPKIIADPVRQMNLMMAELHRIFYHWLKQAMDDSEHWPSPLAGAGSAPMLTSDLQLLVAQGGVIGPLAAQLLAALASPTPPPSTPAVPPP